MSEICREKTLLEELKDLEIDDIKKERLIFKCEKLLDELSEMHTYLSNSNYYCLVADKRINELEQTIANMCVKKYGKAKWKGANDAEQEKDS